MGRHTAADGASAHPLVAAALAQRPADVPSRHSSEGASSREGSSVGWPKAPEPGGGSVGWPGRSGEEQQEGAAEDATPVKAKRGWRRLFGSAPAA